MNNLDRQYLNLVDDIIKNGTTKTDRTGTGTISLFGKQIRHKMREGFPLLTTKKVSFDRVVSELIWFLRGGTNVKQLLQQNNHIWVGDAYKNYSKKSSDNPLLTQKEYTDKILSDDDFAKVWGELGPIYGKQWTSWEGIDWENFINTDKLADNELNRGLFYKTTEVNQIESVSETLSSDPDSRRLLVTAWNPGDLNDMVLPPCHYSFQLYSRELTYSERYRIWFNNNYETGLEYHEEIVPNFDDPYYNKTPKRGLSLLWNQRSCDVGLGLPFNIASYGLLLLMFADEVGMYPDELIGNLGDTHIYSNHVEGLQEQMTREPHPLPTVKIRDGLFSCNGDDITLLNYKSHKSIKLPLSN